MSHCLPDIIRTLLREWQLQSSELSPEVVNSKYMRRFIQVVIIRMGGYSEELTDASSYSPEHSWIEYKGRCYDALCPDGVNDYKQLPALRFEEKNKCLIVPEH
jgi:hypothetical protein